MERQYCQSCGMPLDNKELWGTEKNGTKTEEYCKYCYENGAYTANCTMDEMIELCIPFMVESDPNMNEEQARSMMQSYFPKLKRWSVL